MEISFKGSTDRSRIDHICPKICAVVDAREHYIRRFRRNRIQIELCAVRRRTVNRPRRNPSCWVKGRILSNLDGTSDCQCMRRTALLMHGSRNRHIMYSGQPSRKYADPFCGDPVIVQNQDIQCQLPFSRLDIRKAGWYANLPKNRIRG